MPTNLFTRDDTLLGVCEGLGEEFGFNADYLRVMLGAALLWNAAAVVAGYLAVGVVLAAARRAWPRRPAVAANDEGCRSPGLREGAWSPACRFHVSGLNSNPSCAAPSRSR